MADARLGQSYADASVWRRIGIKIGLFAYIKRPAQQWHEPRSMRSTRPRLSAGLPRIRKPIGLWLLSAALFAASPAVALAQSGSQEESGAARRAITVELVSLLSSERAAQNAEAAAREDEWLRRYEAISEARRAEAARSAQREATLRASRREVAALRRQKDGWIARFLAKDAEFQRAQRALAEMKTEKAERERRYELDMAALRSAATAIVATASPEKLECLKRFAAGQRREAFPCIQQQTRLENEARDRAEVQIAAERADKHRRSKADNLRSAALLALEMLGRGDLAVESAIAAWQEVLATGAAERMDHLVLAGLWSAAADDVRALQSVKVGMSLPRNPDFESRYPLASYVEALNRGGSGSPWFALASAVRSPIASAAGQGPDHAAPDPRLAPVLEKIGTCEESLAAAMAWAEAESRRQVAVELGSVNGPPPQPQGPKPPTACTEASSELASTLRDSGLSAQVREAMVASSYSLAANAAAAGDDRTSRGFVESGLRYCGEAEGTREAGPLLAVGCIILRLQEADALVGPTPDAADRKLSAALDRLAGLTLTAFPTPEAAWIVPVAYLLGASIYDDLRQVPRATAAIREGIAASDRILATLRVRPQSMYLRFDLLVESARLAGLGENEEHAEQAFAKAEQEIRAFLVRHPNSSGACDRFDSLIEEEMGWRARAHIGGSLARVEEILPQFDRCDLLDNRLETDARHPDTGMRLRQMMRLHFYYEISEAARRRGEDEQAVEALERVAALYESISGEPTRTLAIYHATVRNGLGNQYLLRGDMAKAEAHFMRAIELAGNRAPVAAIGAWRGLALVKMRVEDQAGMEAAWLERHRICARRPYWESSFDRAGSLTDQNESLGFDIGCTLVFPWEAQHAIDSYDAAVTRLRAAGAETGRQAGRRAELQEALFYLGAARLSVDDVDGARAAFESSIRLGRGAGNPIAPFAMARLAGLPRGRSWWPRLLRWLTQAERKRALGIEEQALKRRAQDALAKGAG